MKKRLLTIMLSISVLVSVSGCGIYSFSGTSIAPDVKTFTVEYFANKALKVNPSLSNDLSEALIDKYRKLTSLEMLAEGGDIKVSGDIVGYDTKPMAITAQEVAAQTRLTVSVKVMYVNTLHPEEDFEKSFSAYADFDSMQSLDSVESTLCEEIIKIIVEDIFNATVANW